MASRKSRRNAKKNEKNDEEELLNRQLKDVNMYDDQMTLNEKKQILQTLKESEMTACEMSRKGCEAADCFEDAEEAGPVSPFIQSQLKGDSAAVDDSHIGLKNHSTKFLEKSTDNAVSWNEKKTRRSMKMEKKNEEEQINQQLKDLGMYDEHSSLDEKKQLLQAVEESKETSLEESFKECGTFSGCMDVEMTDAPTLVSKIQPTPKQGSDDGRIRLDDHPEVYPGKSSGNAVLKTDTPKMTYADKLKRDAVNSRFVSEEQDEELDHSALKNQKAKMSDRLRSKTVKPQEAAGSYIPQGSCASKLFASAVKDVQMQKEVGSNRDEKERNDAVPERMKSQDKKSTPKFTEKKAFEKSHGKKPEISRGRNMVELANKSNRAAVSSLQLDSGSESESSNSPQMPPKVDDLPREEKYEAQVSSLTADDVLAMKRINEQFSDLKGRMLNLKPRPFPDNVKGCYESLYKRLQMNEKRNLDNQLSSRDQAQWGKMIDLNPVIVNKRTLWTSKNDKSPSLNPTVLITPLRQFPRMAADDFDSPSSSFSFKLDMDNVMKNIESPVNQTRNHIQVADSDDDFQFGGMSKQASGETKDSCVCPICGKEFPKKQIEAHADKCFNYENEDSRPYGTRSRMNEQGRGSNDARGENRPPSRKSNEEVDFQNSDSDWEGADYGAKRCRRREDGNGKKRRR